MQINLLKPTHQFLSVPTTVCFDSSNLARQVASHVRMARDTCGGAIVSLGGKCLAYFSSLASDLIAYANRSTGCRKMWYAS